MVSQNSCIFSKEIINKLYELLRMKGVEFTKKNIIRDNVDKKTLISSDNTF